MTHIKANELEAIAITAGNEANRCYLNGVYVELYKDGTYGLISTDGHRLSTLCIQEKENVTDSFILSNGDIKKLLTLWKCNKKQEIHIFYDGSTIDCSLKLDDHVQSQFTTRPIDGNYPDFRRVIPSRDSITPSASVCFNANYISDFGKMKDLLTGTKLRSVRLEPVDDSKALVDLDVDGFVGVLMLMRF